MSLVDKETSERSQNLWLLVVAGGLSLFIAMGVGRFAYTPILPWMQAQTHFSNAIAGFLASSNYLGYLVGAFLAGSVSWIRRQRLFTFRWSLLLCILTTGAMALTSNVWIWYVLRCVSGISSGLVFVLVSSIVLDELAHHNRSTLSGMFYGGVGLGIAVTGLLVPAIGHPFGWRGTWLAMMILSILLGIPATLGIRSSDTRVQSQPSLSTPTVHGPDRMFWWLTVAYGCEGLGYIITGTFLVAMVAKMPGLQGMAPYTWVLAGVAALPSCILWSTCARRFGEVRILVTAYLVQTVGVLLPVISPTALGGYVGAVLFGGTFMGITTLATMLGRKLRSNDSSKAIGLMTGVYGIGQIVGAGGAGLLAGSSGGFRVPTVVASVVLFVGAICLIVGRLVRGAKEANAT